MGFNNTGNLCVWPSEESLAYYILNNLEVFEGKMVLELGSGMSALAGLMVAKYGMAKQVLLTDGNLYAVDNIRKSLMFNVFQSEVDCCVLQWGVTKISGSYDVILSADCLFFDDARIDLVNTIYELLNEDGLAYVIAPCRGGTLDIFEEFAQKKGFLCERLFYYDDVIWKKHLECLKNSEYDQNLHYPILLILKKMLRQ